MVHPRRAGRPGTTGTRGHGRLGAPRTPGR
jgi:hypothetical protein